MKRILLYILFLIIIVSSSPTGDPIKIMPVGNSITASEHYSQQVMGERTGYRKNLYEMLINFGYDVDFVVSQKHGERPEDDPDWYDWNCEAYPGWQINSIVNKVKSALPIYEPEILLVHVRTNGDSWDNKPGQVRIMGQIPIIHYSNVRNY